MIPYNNFAFAIAAPVITTQPFTTNDNTPTIQGVAENNSIIKLYDGAIQVGSTIFTSGTSLFGTATNHPVGVAPWFVAIGDFNEDSNQDLAVANLDSDNVSILLGTGTGSFGTPTNFSVGNQPYGITIGDFNEDLNQDLAVANYITDNVSILLGTGTGSFGTPTSFSAGNGPRGVAIGDFNEASNQDLAVANGAGNGATILLGTGTGSFGTHTSFSAGSDPHSLAIGDFNEDSNQDLAVGSNNNARVAILLGTGTGSFGTPTYFTGTGVNPQIVAIGDFNEDSNQDLAVATSGSDRVSILLGTGTGSFGTPVNIPAGNNPFSVAIGDFNGDSKQDLVTANSASDNITLLLGTGTGSFGTPIGFPTGDGARGVTIGDFNGDSKQDLAVANSFADNISILLNTASMWSIDTTPLSDGFHVITATATDASSNVSIPSNSIVVIVDTTSPNTVLISHPSNPTNSASASFSFTSTEPGTFECQIDGSLYSVCTNSKSYSSLSDGSHTFNVRAKDSVGNTDPTPATYTWTVDTVAPEISFVSLNPTIVGGSSQIQITKIVTDTGGVDTIIATIKGPSPSTTTIGSLPLSLISGTIQSGTWSGTFTFPSNDIAPDGIYTVEEQVTDTSGNTLFMIDGMIMVDRTAPTLSVISITPSFLRPTDLVTVTASASDALSGVSSITAQDSTTGDLPVSLALISGSTDPGEIGNFQGFITGALPEGTHDVTVSTKDNAVTQNENSVTVPNSFTLDATPPTLTLPSDMTLEATGYSGAIAQYSVSASDNIDVNVPVNCDVPSGTELPFGNTLIICSATDTAGNTSTGSFIVNVVDTTGPTLNLPSDITAEATSASGASVTYSATATDLVDGDVAPSCSPASGSTFPLGSTTVSCTLTDSSGNSISGMFIVTVVDTTAPNTTIISAVDGSSASVTNGGTTSSNSMTFTFTGNDNVGVTEFYCSLDSGSFVSCTSPSAFAGLIVGSHTFNVKAIDGASIFDPTPEIFGWSIVSDLTLKQKIQNIIDQVQDLVNQVVLNKGQGNSLIVKLDAAIKSLDKDDSKTASNQLNAFVNEANALIKSKGLAVQIQPLINQANSIINQLST